MTRNQFTRDVTKYSACPIFTVDANGDVAPPETQGVSRGGSLLLHAATSASTTPYSGYVCVRAQGVCSCAAVIGNLFGLPHMKISDTAYHIRSDAPESDFEIYAVTDEGPIAGATNGDIHVGS